MTQTPQSDLKLPDLRIVPVPSLVPHERQDETRTASLALRLREAGVLKNPPVVTPLPSPDGSERYVVLDGANRAAAASVAGLPHLLVQVVRYGDPGIRLSTWHHALTGISCDSLEQGLAALSGLERLHDDLHRARALLARREAIAYVICDAERAIILRGGVDLAERNDLLNAVVDLYSNRVPFHRVLRESLDAARARFPDVTALFMFPQFQPDEILEIATSGAKLPAGITRHVIPWRALRVNVPLDVLSDPARPLEEKNRWLAAWITERVAERHVRFYEESTVLFDE
ncbi:MAG: hypothetical protein HY568_07095 [Candidatus Latescibacteria bacterium]|nr:hypothetical protein [Candidatus Latescibacterota bacterium]